jgi:8-hydroxy-5-deazaflavin:NADPH oxidoreductase
VRIGVLGSGLMGGKLGTIFVRAGHEVVFSYSHDYAKLERLARNSGGVGRAGTPADAARDADVVLIAVHWSRVSDVVKQAGDLKGKIVLSCTLPMNDDDTELVIGLSSSGAEEMAKQVPGASVVSAFNTVPSEVLFSVFEQAPGSDRPSLAFCGDSKTAKETAARLIRDVGFEPVDVGPLRIARYMEPFGLLVARIAYEGEGGAGIAYRFDELEEREA